MYHYWLWLFNLSTNNNKRMSLSRNETEIRTEILDEICHVFVTLMYYRSSWFKPFPSNFHGTQTSPYPIWCLVNINCCLGSKELSNEMRGTRTTNACSNDCYVRFYVFLSCRDGAPLSIEEKGWYKKDACTYAKTQCPKHCFSPENP